MASEDMGGRDDMDLVRAYALNQSEPAFEMLVGRHVNLVYSSALRQVRDPHLAEEVVQAVFILLARKADTLGPRTILPSWLHRAACFVAADVLKAGRRRAQREQEAYMQSSLNESENETWPLIAPLLDTAIAGLDEKDRHAIVLRFFQDQSLNEIGAAIGISEEAAKKRVSRALERLQKYFLKHGVRSTTAVIAGAMLANSVQAAPAALGKSVAAVAMAKGATASASTLTLIKGALKVMAWTQAKTAVVAVVVAGLAAYSLVQHRAEEKLRSENDAMQQELVRLRAENESLTAKRVAVPHLPAPQITVADVPPTNPPAINTNLYARLYGRLGDKMVKLTPDQVDAYLKANGRTAATLLAAFRTSGDNALLAEAMEKFPNDPQVAFEAALDKDLSPAEQRRWLDTFEKSAPDNALAYYLSALNNFNAGQVDQGVQELSVAANKPLDDYTVSRVENDMEAYLAGGYSIADAEVLASAQLLLPQLAQLKQLALDSADLANAYNKAGDATSAQAVALLADSLGEKYSTPYAGESAISQLVGIVMEKIALGTMNPGDPYGDGGQTVQERLAQLQQQQTSVQQTSQQVSDLLPSLTDQDWVVYKNRWLMFGEANAEQWVIGKYGQN